MRKWVLFLFVSVCVASCSSGKVVGEVGVGLPSPLSEPVNPEYNKPLPKAVVLPVRTINVTD